MNKRDLVLSFLDDRVSTPVIPAGFFIHFDPVYHRGPAAVDQHLAYFRKTGMDFVKIQYENRFPIRPEISKPADWAKMPCYGADFYADPINIAKGLVETVGKEALVLMTLYSPFMCAGQSVGKDILVKHLKENPAQTRKGIEIIAESLLTFVNGCIAVGVDGFYHSTQGGESHRFEGSSIFDTCIRPYDLAVMEEIERACEFSILHVCDYEGGYQDLTPFRDYPGQVVNASLHLGERKVSAQEISDLFGRPFMGGVDRLGVIATGNQDQVREAVTRVCQQSPSNFILGADCTLPGDINWENIQTAIDAAHQFQK